MVAKAKIYDYFLRGLAEFFANVLVLSLGCIGALSTDLIMNTSLQLGFCFGFIVLAVYQTFWMISGAHITPPITIAALIVGKIDWRNALVYIPCQFLGAILGQFVAMLLLPEVAYTSTFTTNEICLTTPNDIVFVTPLRAFGIEFVITSAWVFVMLRIWSRPDDLRDNAALQIGITVLITTFASVVATGASMSPARTLAAAIYHGIYRHIWVYFAGPLLAGVVIAVIWRFFYLEENLNQWTKKKGNNAQNAA